MFLILASYKKSILKRFALIPSSGEGRLILLGAFAKPFTKVLQMFVNIAELEQLAIRLYIFQPNEQFSYSCVKLGRNVIVQVYLH